MSDDPRKHMRAYPQDASAEKGVLASFLLTPQVVGGMLEGKEVRPEWFFTPAHAEIFRELMAMWQEGKPIDFITLTTRLRDRGELDRVGGGPYLNELFVYLPTAANVSYYLDILREKLTLRRVIDDCTDLIRRCYDEPDSVDKIVDDYQSRAVSVGTTQSASTRKFTPLKAILMDSVTRLMERAGHRGSISGACTGIVDIDRMSDGIADQEMWLVVGRPSMGKTALAFQIALFAARRNSHHDNPEKWYGLPTVIFSVEMGEAILGDRLVAQITGINIKRFADGFLPPKEQDKLIMEATRKLSDYAPDASTGRKVQLWVDDTPALSIQQLTARVRYAVEQMGVKLVIVDYAQLLNSSSKRAKENRLQEVQEISTGLKNIARAFKVKLVVAAQLNRDVDDRPGHVPLLSDLRECGQLEQDADVVLAPVRPGYYAKTEAQKAKLIERVQKTMQGKQVTIATESGEYTVGEVTEGEAMKYAEVHILKQRNGQTGFAPCWYYGEQCHFAGWTKKLFSNNAAERQVNAEQNRDKAGAASKGADE